MAVKKAVKKAAPVKKAATKAPTKAPAKPPVRKAADTAETCPATHPYGVAEDGCTLRSGHAGRHIGRLVTWR